MADICLSEEWRDRVKAATRDLVSKAGGQIRAANISGWGKTSVDRWGSARHPDVIPLMAALILERDVGCPFVTQVMAEINGLSIGAREAAGELPGFQESFLNLTRVKADLVAKVVEASADGDISINEAMAIDRKLGRVVEKATRMRETLAREKAGRGRK